MRKRDNSYIGISFIILVFGIIFIPRIIDRLNNKDIVRDESRSGSVNYTENVSDLMYLEINGERKKVPNFAFTNQAGELITNDDYKGKVYVVEFFFTTCPTICPIMNYNLVEIQNTFNEFDNLGFASFTINPTYDTVEVLSDYANQYGITNQNWNLLTGDKEEIYNLANNGFNLYTAQEDSAAGGFEHSGNFALIDKEGYIRCRSDKFGNPLIYYKGAIDFKEKVDSDGEAEEISILKEDILKLLK
jgi:protein SCO1/2|tara:strand:- start:170 stop:907 length:738 start_codon:yes stop_codon:yes gene_type:complete